MENQQGAHEHDSSVPSHLAAAIEELGLTDEESSILVQELGEDVLGLAVYGSRARGDFVDTSDFDLLRLATKNRKTIKLGRVSVSTYTTDQLKSASTTLFGTHLRRDARVLYDRKNELEQIISGLQPANPDVLLDRVKTYSIILEVTKEEVQAKIPRMVKLSRYLLRTAIYAIAMQSGRPCFSVRELATRFSDPDLATLLASDAAVTGPPTESLYREIYRRLRVITGPAEPNPYPTLMATAAGFWSSDPLLAAMALHASGETADDFDYSDLPKVML